MIVHLAIRGYLKSTLQWESLVDIDSDKLDELLPSLAEKHAEECVTGKLGMIEIEFLDEPNPNERYFRMGVDPSGMVMPMEIKL